MSYESSYTSGRKPFLPDTKRGYWDLPKDFVFAGVALALRIDGPFNVAFTMTRLSIFVIVPYLICLALYVVPIMVIQGFLGQFSSSGFISVFRLSPLFKGIGYLALAVDFTVLAYYIIFANIPLLFVVNSFRWTLPWSCEKAKAWSANITQDNPSHNCNIKEVIEEIQSNNDTDSYFGYNPLSSTSQIYITSYLGNESYDDMSKRLPPTLSLEMLACSLLTWGFLAFVLTRYFDAEKFSKVVRYGMCTIVGLLLLCCTRFLFLPGAHQSLNLKELDFFQILIEVHHAITYSTVALGSGFGTFISISSFNRFNSNIMRNTWYIAIGQLIIFYLFIIVTNSISHHFLWMVAQIDEEAADFTGMREDLLFVYFHAASAITSMEFPNLWTFVFYGMLTISAWMVMLVQLYSMLTTIFDEFEYLRQKKKEFTFGFIGLLAICSAYFSTSDGVNFFQALQTDAIFTQTSLHLLLLLIVLWIYGRERFQRDIEFMIGEPFRTWKINVLRFIAPLFILYVTLAAAFGVYFEHIYGSLVVLIAAVIMITIPWLAIPLYAVWSVFRTSGSFVIRFKRSARATDWYPVQPDDRQRYEESVGNVDLTHQLTVMEEHP